MLSSFDTNGGITVKIWTVRKLKAHLLPANSSKYCQLKEHLSPDVPMVFRDVNSGLNAHINLLMPSWAHIITSRPVTCTFCNIRWITVIKTLTYRVVRWLVKNKERGEQRTGRDEWERSRPTCTCVYLLSMKAADRRSEEIGPIKAHRGQVLVRRTDMEAP